MDTREAQICVGLHTAVHEAVSVHVCPSPRGNFLTGPGIPSTAPALSSTESSLPGSEGARVQLSGDGSCPLQVSQGKRH